MTWVILPCARAGGVEVGGRLDARDDWVMLALAPFGARKSATLGRANYHTSAPRTTSAIGDRSALAPARLDGRVSFDRTVRVRLDLAGGDREQGGNTRLYGGLEFLGAVVHAIGRVTGERRLHALSPGVAHRSLLELALALLLAAAASFETLLRKENAPKLKGEGNGEPHDGPVEPSPSARPHVDEVQNRTDDQVREKRGDEPAEA